MNELYTCYRDHYDIPRIIKDLEKTQDAFRWLTGKSFREITEALDLLKELEHYKHLNRNDKDYIDELPF